MFVLTSSSVESRESSSCRPSARRESDWRESRSDEYGESLWAVRAERSGARTRWQLASSDLACMRARSYIVRGKVNRESFKNYCHGADALCRVCKRSATSVSHYWFRHFPRMLSPGGHTLMTSCRSWDTATGYFNFEESDSDEGAFAKAPA